MGEFELQKIAKLEAQIKKFKEIAVHVREHCCDDCEDSSMCEFGCAIFELQASLGGKT